MKGAAGIDTERRAPFEATRRDPALAPVDFDGARAMVERLRCAPLLTGWCNLPRLDIDALARTISSLSVLSVALADEILEIDVNPIIVKPDGCIAVDALVINKTKEIV